MFEESIRTHEEYDENIRCCYGDVQSTNAYRILKFLGYGNENAIKRVSNNPETSMTAYFSVPSTKRWAGIITGNDKILLLADNDIVDKFKEKIGAMTTIIHNDGTIEEKELQFANFSWNRGAIVIPTDMDSGLVDNKGNLMLDMELAVDFGKYCLSEDTPPYGKLDSAGAEE